MQQNGHIEQLLLKFLQANASNEEIEQIKAWANQTPENRRIFQRLENGTLLKQDLAKFLALADSPEALVRFERMKAHIQQEAFQKKTIRLQQWLPYAAAAIVLITAAIGAWFIYSVETPSESTYKTATLDIQPGGSRATLTLPDGRILDLNEAQDEIIIGHDIRYNNGSPVTTAPADGATRNLGNMSISTPKGGTYKITLSDGTQVWLNAASKLTYPTQFDDKERLVELEGEAYFDVATQVSKHHKNQRIPFRVVTKDQIIDVLGTQFNISNYPDEKESRTTLVTGAVEITNRLSNKTMSLKPGEQGTVKWVYTTVSQVNTTPFISWKNNSFYFDETPLSEAMNQLSRWYDLEVEYRKGIPQTHFYGEIRRNRNLSEVLEILAESGLKFQIIKEADKNRLIVRFK